MALIKGATSDRLVKGAMVLDLSDLGLQAERMMARAKHEASAIVAEAQAEAKRLIAGGDERGHAEGLKRGEQEGRAAGEAAAREEVKQAFSARLEELATKWLEAVTKWETDRRDMYLEAKEDVARFAMEVARKVVRRTVEGNGAIVGEQVMAALGALNRPTAVTIRVHPEERALVDDLMPRFKAGLETCEHIKLVEDEQIGKGGCVVQTAGGSVDARIETQMDRIADAIVTGKLAIDDASERKDTP